MRFLWVLFLKDIAVNERICWNMEKQSAEDDRNFGILFLFLKFRINSIKQLTTVINCYILFIKREGLYEDYN